MTTIMKMKASAFKELRSLKLNLPKNAFLELTNVLKSINCKNPASENIDNLTLYHSLLREKLRHK